MMSRILLVMGFTVALAADPKKRPNMTEWKARQATKSAKTDAKAAREAKMAAVNKVVTMLEELQAQILDEGEKEAATYNKFSCFCKDTTAEKTAAIEAGRDKKAELTSTIDKLANKRAKLDSKIEDLTEAIEKLEKEIKEAKEERAKELKVYQANAADLAAALEALEGAIKVMKASKGPSLVELKSVAKTFREAAMLADALGINSPSQHKAVLFLQEAPEVNMEDYKFHSDDIIATLEKLQDAFRKEKNEVDEEEVKSVQAHTMLVQEKTDLLKTKNGELEETKKEKADTKELIAENSQELTTVAATLLDDQQYLGKLAEMCTNTAKTWDQRSKVRSDELSTLVAAISIVKDSVKGNTSAKTVRFAQQGVIVHLAEAAAHSPEALEAIEADAEAADEQAGTPVTFLQRLMSKPAATAKTAFLATRVRASPNDAEEAVVTLLRDKGQQLKSTLLMSLANHISADPFAKVKQLIQELIERLLTEAANEANQKGWCDKASADAKQKREQAATEIEELNAKMAELEAEIGELTEELAVLKKEIAELKANRKQAEKLRKEEKAENEATLLEANAGLEAVKMAIDVLDKFYKTVDDAKVDLSLAQQGPGDDAPDAGFDIGEAYTGAQGAATGIIGMLDVIKSDFERTIKETTKEEAEAEKEHLEFMTKTGISLAEKEMAQEQKKKYKSDAEEQLEEASDSLNDHTEILSKAIAELLDLKPVCVDTGMSYKERVARRQDEIDALNKALCILKAYAEYGPDGAAQEC